MSTSDSVNLWWWFRRALRVNASREAIVFGTERWTYTDVAAAVAAATSRLRAAGAGAGERVLLLTENGPTFPIHDLAIMALGAVKVPLNAQLTAHEIEEISDRVRAAAVVVSPSLTPLVAGLPEAVARVDATLSLDTVARDVEPAWSIEGPNVAGTDPAVIYFTGGTTGRPKGILHTQSGVAHNLLAHLLESGIGTTDRLLLTTPLPHAAGLFTLAGLLRGACVHIEPGFDAQRTIVLIDREQITWTFAVPTMIYRLLDAGAATDWRPASLRTIQYGAAPISAARLTEALERFGPVLQQLYAQTECPNFATVLSKADHADAVDRPDLLRSCGRATVMCDVTVLDADGNQVGPGTVGEVALDSPFVMAGYWDDPDAAAERFCGRWLRTGDVGYLDDDGFLFLVDRRNDMIVTGGMNVYSVEVEQALAKHPDVALCAAVGRPHDDWGEAVHAVVVLADGATADEAALVEHCRAELAAYKRPKSYEFVTELPLTKYGKIDKKAIREPFWAGASRSVG